MAVDGTGAGHGQTAGYPLCHPVRDGQSQVLGSLHHFVMMSVVGTGLALPFDVEPYGPGDSEYAAGQRILQRAVAQVGRRFADCVVVDSEFATAPLLHVAGDLGSRVVARLRESRTLIALRNTLLPHADPRGASSEERGAGRGCPMGRIERA